MAFKCPESIRFSHDAKLEPQYRRAVEQAVDYLEALPAGERPVFSGGTFAIAMNGAAEKMEREILKGVTTPSREAYFEILTRAVRAAQLIVAAGKEEGAAESALVEAAGGGGAPVPKSPRRPATART